LVRMLSPDIRPIIVGGSGDKRGVASVRKEAEKAMMKRAVDIMTEIGVIFEEGKLESDLGTRGTAWLYQMRPPLDTLVTYETASTMASTLPAARFAVRQVLDQEYQKNIIVRESAARQARYRAGNLQGAEDFVFSKEKENSLHLSKENVVCGKRDFFGRAVRNETMPLQEVDCNAVANSNTRKRKAQSTSSNEGEQVWVTFHEGFSNAVRKSITVEELLRGL